MNRTHFVALITLMIRLLASASSPTPSHPRSGKDWLSWTPEQRFVFLDAYTAGYSLGKTSACDIAADLFRPNEEITDVSRQPSARCLEKTKSYSRSADYYSQLITDFYTRCPKYEAAPLLYLMMLLSDDRLKTAAELCKEGVRTEF